MRYFIEQESKHASQSIFTIIAIPLLGFFIASKKKNSFCTFHLDVLGRIMQDLSTLILRTIKGEAELALETGNNMLLSLTGDAIFKVDDKGKIISVNNAIEFSFRIYSRGAFGHTNR